MKNRLTEYGFGGAIPVPALLAGLIGATPHLAADSRVRQALQAAELKFLETPTGDFMVPFRLPNDRKHLVWIESRTSQLGRFEIRDIWAVSFLGQTAPSAEVLEQLLAAGGRLKIGAFELHSQADGPEPKHYAVVFKAKVAADLSADHLKAVLWAVADTADGMEATLTGSDSL